VDDDEIVRACQISMASRFRRIPNMYLFTRALSSFAYSILKVHWQRHFVKTFGWSKPVKT